MDAKNQRRLKNILLDQKFQLPFAIILAVMPLFVLSCILLYAFYAAITTFSASGAFSCLEVSTLENIKAHLFNTLWGGVGMVSLLTLTTFTFTVVLTHRIVGPLVPIMRQIQYLRESKYDFRITLRKYDYFQNLAQALNELAADLEKRKST